MAATTHHGAKISELTPLETLADGIKGYWLKEWGSVKLTVVRGHAFLSSNIATEATAVSMDLPTHQPFYAQILSSSGVRTVLVETNLNLTLDAGEQLQAVFTVEV